MKSPTAAYRLLRWRRQLAITTSALGLIARLRYKDRIMNAYAFLAGAIVFEVIATTAMKASDGFSRLTPSLLCVICYAICFYLLAQTLKTIPTGVAYAIWSGVGIILISLIAWLLYGQRLDLPTMIGMGLIIAGVAIINLFSSANAH